MNITCPKCNFSRRIEPAKVPERQVRVTCPKCSEGFTFDRSQHLADSAGSSTQHAPPEQICCPACGLVQDKAENCGGCGVVYAKFRARQEANGTGPVDPLHGNLAELRRMASAPAVFHQPKAGFWIRSVAYLLDSVLLGAVQLTLSLLIGLIVGMLGLTAEGDPSTNVVLWLFGATLSLSYGVFFTGYCGQTPGKMALRIKVIRCDGSPVRYGRAALREVPGKFISGILLGIGYLMVAFDSQKQGLHDKMADTYVIKL